MDFKSHLKKYGWAYEHWTGPDPEDDRIDPEIGPVSCWLCNLIYIPHPTEKNVIYCQQCNRKIQFLDDNEDGTKAWYEVE